MSSLNGAKVADTRRLLVQRIAASPFINKSVRLRDLLFYLCDRVLEERVEQIHEQEVGHRVFGRAPDYDTTADNIVRVHASQLRKRLSEYFFKEGAHEPIIIEIPKGNYAPVFRERGASRLGARTVWSAGWLVWALAATALLFSSTTVVLLIREHRGAKVGFGTNSAVHLLWSRVFQANRRTDIILDDATIGLYQDLTKQPIAIKDYYNRNYLRRLPERGAVGLDREAASSIVIRRYSSYAAVAPLWRLFEISEGAKGQAVMQFARDYSFHGLKTDNVILLGSSQSNPWVESFENQLGLRWTYDKELESLYPVDTWDERPDTTKFHTTTQTGDSREGYCAISLLSNLGANGSVLLISATGGSAMSACADFLSNEEGVSRLRSRLADAKDGLFPHFEALLAVKGRSTLPRDVRIALSRPPRE